MCCFAFYPICFYDEDYCIILLLLFSVVVAIFCPLSFSLFVFALIALLESRLFWKQPLNCVHTLYAWLCLFEFHIDFNFGN